MEAFMQRYPDNLSESDRRIARKWTLASFGIYGTLLAGFILYAAFHPATAPVQFASDTASKASAGKSSRDDIFEKFAKVTQRRFCGQVAC
jgi:hypothetical protein